MKILKLDEFTKLKKVKEIIKEYFDIKLTITIMEKSYL